MSESIPRANPSDSWSWIWIWRVLVAELRAPTLPATPPYTPAHHSGVVCALRRRNFAAPFPAARVADLSAAPPSPHSPARADPIIHTSEISWQDTGAPPRPRPRPRRRHHYNPLQHGDCRAPLFSNHRRVCRGPVVVAAARVPRSAARQEVRRMEGTEAPAPPDAAAAHVSQRVSRPLQGGDLRADGLHGPRPVEADGARVPGRGDVLRPPDCGAYRGRGASPKTYIFFQASPEILSRASSPTSLSSSAEASVRYLSKRDTSDGFRGKRF